MNQKKQKKEINNEQIIIKDGKKQYYLIDNKLYKIKKDKSQGVLFGSYIDGKIMENK
jgi:predicted lipoprotein with Yx(FWY)xxD motif